MRCPQCQASESRVVDTSADPQHAEIRRRRECQACGTRFTTVEQVRDAWPLVIKSGAGKGAPARREPFDPEKIRHGVTIACAKRPISQAAIERLVESIQGQVLATGLREIPSHSIGEMVSDALRELDPVAYIRYAIVFLGLEDLSAIRGEIDRLLARQASARRINERY